MHYTSTKNISLEQIQFFLMIARLQSFTEAAEVLCVSQPMLSRRISMLEQEVGLQLFNREKRQIRLTEDGEWLYTKWSDLLGQFEETIESAHQRRICRRINIGCDEMLWPMDNYLFPLIERLHSSWQDVDVNLECFEYPRLRRRLSSGAVDAILLGSSSPPQDSSELNWRRLITVPNYVGINRKNPLAQKESIRWEDLKDECFLIFSPTTSEDYYRSVVGACRLLGFEPRTRSYVNKASIILNLKLNNGIHVGAPFGFAGNEPSIRLYELPGKKTSLFIGWRGDEKTGALIDTFCQAARDSVPPEQ